MNRIPLGSLILFLLTGIAVTVSAQSSIGLVESTSGIVDIDPFGAGEFVEVEVPEAIYSRSVIRTDYESWAYLSIDGVSHMVGPDSLTPVSTFVTDRRRNRGKGFFSRILRELTQSLAPPEREEIVAGGRARRVESDGSTWVLDIDPDELYEEALTAIADEQFEVAVEALRLIEYPVDGSFDIEEYYVNLVYSLMGIGDFHAAKLESFAYAVADPIPSNVGRLTPRLQLLGGISAFYSGDDTNALAMLEEYLKGVSLDSASVEGVAVLYTLLRDTGRDSDASSLLARARRAQPQVDWDAATNL